MIDSNLNWVKVTVTRPDEVSRVPAVISSPLARDGLRQPVGAEIVVQFSDRPASDGVDLVRYVVEQELGKPMPEWMVVEEGSGNAMWIYRNAWGRRPNSRSTLRRSPRRTAEERVRPGKAIVLPPARPTARHRP